jgi:hypothetical protein
VSITAPELSCRFRGPRTVCKRKYDTRASDNLERRAVAARKLDQPSALEQGYLEWTRSGTWHAASNAWQGQTISVGLNPDRISGPLY